MPGLRHAARCSRRARREPGLGPRPDNDIWATDIQFIVVSGEKPDKLAVYSIQAESGALNSIGHYPTGKGADWVEIVTFD
jgi:6-phosphogluconolactonase (cycloisomerase 2 family)